MPIIDETGYKSPYFLSNAHLGTIVPNLLRFTFGVNYQRERIFTADGDFLDIDWSVGGNKRLVILSHGLESSSRATYIVGMVKHFNRHGYDTLAWNFRSCSGEVNLTVPFYHPGQTDDYQLVVDAAIARGYQEIYLAGFSLGGAITLRYLGELGEKVRPEIKRAVVFSVPTDLSASAHHLSEGNQAMYGRAFLFKYRRKMNLKAKKMPEHYDMTAWDHIQTMIDFDEAFNVPWHHHRNAEEFYAATTPKDLLTDIGIPTLIVNAMNDPFLPPACYPWDAASSRDNLFLEVPELGGHVGFMTLSWKGITWSEGRAQAFFEG
ncbi:MAG: alpha/beta fold hydrolase [Bacteroidetes bacterium]|nr:alpha/beta fold hydrolase [Bacteroidota bacterium]